MSKLIIFCLLIVSLLNVQARGFEFSTETREQIVNTAPENINNLIGSDDFTTMGETTFSILFWDLYTSQLLTTSGEYPISAEGESLIFHISYLADISSDDLIMRTVEQWQHLGVNEQVYKQYIADLELLWPDIVSGDSLALLLKDDKSTFYYNNQYLGSIKDDGFGQLFIDIWLSKDTSQPTLRAELLGASYEK